MQVEGLTADLSEGGCCVMARRMPFSPGTPIRLEITKDGASLQTDATVIYNLKDQIIGVRFPEMAAPEAAVLAKWIKAASAPRSSRFD
jgi:PilZ domain-containing protein